MNFSWKIFAWLLPIMDVFKIKKILSCYSSWGVDVPSRHARYGLIERWVGYLPVGFVIFWLLDPLSVLTLLALILALIGPIEFYLMYRAVGPWKFFKGARRRLVAKIFLLEGYNSFGYFFVGGLIEKLLFG